MDERIQRFLEGLIHQLGTDSDLEYEVSNPGAYRRLESEARALYTALGGTHPAFAERR